MLTRTVVYTGDFKNAWNEDGCALQPLLCNVSNGEKKQLLTCGDSAHPPLKEPFKNKKIKKGRKSTLRARLFWSNERKWYSNLH